MASLKSKKSEAVDIERLCEFQSTLLSQKFLDKNCRLYIIVVEITKNSLLDKIKSISKEYFKSKLDLIVSYDSLAPILDPKIQLSKKLLCTNPQEYLGLSYEYLMKVFLAIRNSPPLLQYLLNHINEVPSAVKLPPDKIAEDLVDLFFFDSDINQNEESGILSHLEFPITNLFMEYLNNNSEPLLGK